MIEVQTAHNVSLTLEPAGLGDRLLAYLIDMLVQIAYVITLAVAFGLLGSLLDITFPGAVYVGLIGVPLLVYFPVFEIALDGQTPGKKARSIRVVRLDGQPPSARDYLIRWALGFVDFTLSSGAVAVAAIALSDRSQRLGDMAAGTTVVSSQPRARLSDTLYERIEEPEPVTYPAAAGLRDDDVRLIRDAVHALRVQGLTAQSKRIAEAVSEIVEAQYGIARGETRVYIFLRTLLHDHTVLARRADAAFEPASS